MCVCVCVWGGGVRGAGGWGSGRVVWCVCVCVFGVGSVFERLNIKIK